MVPNRLFVLTADECMAAIDLQFLVDVFDVIFDRFEGNIEQYNHGTPGNAKAK